MKSTIEKALSKSHLTNWGTSCIKEQGHPEMLQQFHYLKNCVRELNDKIFLINPFTQLFLTIKNLNVPWVF